MSDPVRLGILGCGDHSHAHAAAAEEVPGVRIVAACDVDVAKAEAWVARHDAGAAYGDFSAMLTGARLDGVILCTWPSQHAEQIATCLEHGIKHILCEKALVTSANEARAVLGLVRENAALLVEGSMYRHHPAMHRLEQLLADGRLGRIDSIRAVFHNYEPAAEASASEAANWRRRAECGGGIPHDWMHYLVDACNHFSGSPPRRVFASGDSAPVIERLYGMIEYENGSVGILENSKLADFDQTLQLSCAHGILRLPIAWAIQGEVVITETRRKPHWDFLLQETHRVAHANAFARQLANFCQAVRGVEAPLVPLHDSVVDAITADALVTSLRRGEAVEVDLSGL